MDDQTLRDEIQKAICLVVAGERPKDRWPEFPGLGWSSRAADAVLAVVRETGALFVSDVERGHILASLRHNAEWRTPVGGELSALADRIENGASHGR